MEKSQISFDQFLQEHLTYWDYNNLDTILAESPHRVTKIKNDPSTGRITHLMLLVPRIQKVNKLIDAKFLMTQYDFGKLNISESEMELIEKSPAA